MLFRLRRAVQIRRARPDFTRILTTPPLVGSDDGAVVFSQLQHKDVLTYLVAAKSFAHHTGYGRFVLLDDGSLTAEDRALLRQHLPRIEFRTMSEVHYGTLPVGGTWERLITICDLAMNDFVIQLDADTVTSGPLDEVKTCVAQSHSFTLMAGHTAEMLPVGRIAALAPVDRDHHIQTVAEGFLDRLDPTIATRYGCGCSGFAGFAPDPERRHALERFSARMEELTGPRWREWGTEQVSSNFLVARDPNGVLLPYRRYRNFGGEALTEAAVFVHFFGTFRYDQGTYRGMARDLIACLSAGAHATSVPRLAAE
jgi:hypothetical protein